jgi:hypothetical protein
MSAALLLFKQNRKSGQFTCYKTGQIYLLLRRQVSGDKPNNTKEARLCHLADLCGSYACFPMSASRLSSLKPIHIDFL